MAVTVIFPLLGGVILYQTEVGSLGPAQEFSSVSDPAPASQAYRESLARLYAYKQQLSNGDETGSSEESADIGGILEDEAFGRFVEAQLTWDRAMAEALAEAHRRDPKAIVVGIVGRGHLEYLSLIHI